MPSLFAEDDGISKPALLELAFRQYADDLYRYIYSKVGQAALAEDLTSTVFLKALRWLQQERSQESVRGWLYATARTTVADYWQEQRRYEHLPLERLADEIEGMAEVAELEDPALVARLRVEYLLEHLPSRERLILTLRYLHGYSAAEVAQELGLSAGNVRVLQLRALRRAARLEQEERNVTTTMQSPQESPITNYTEQTQRALDLAREEAVALQHGFVGTEHVLLGLLREGSVTPLLNDLGTNYIRVRGCLDFIYGGTSFPAKDPNSPPGLTPRSQQALKLAGEEAQRMGERVIRPQHALLGLILLGDGIAADILMALSIEIDTVRHAIGHPDEPAARIFTCSFCHQKTTHIIPSNGSSPLRGVLPGRTYICVDCVERFHNSIEQKKASSSP